MAPRHGVTEIADSEDEPMTSPAPVAAEPMAPAHQAPQETVCTHQALPARAAEEASEQAGAIQIEHSAPTDAALLQGHVTALPGGSHGLSIPQPNTKTISPRAPDPANELHEPVATDATERQQEQYPTSALSSHGANSAQVHKEQQVMESNPFELPETGEAEVTTRQNGNVVGGKATDTAGEPQPHDTTTRRSQNLIENETSPAVLVDAPSQAILQSNGDHADTFQSTSTAAPESAESVRAVESSTEQHISDAADSTVSQSPVAQGNHLLESKVGEDVQMNDSTHHVETKIIAPMPAAGIDEASFSMMTNSQHPPKSQERSSSIEETPRVGQNEDQSADTSTKDSLQTGPSMSAVQLSHSQPSPTTQPSPSPVHSVLPKTPQEITLAGLKAQKAALLASLRALPAIQVLMEEMASTSTGMSDGDDEPTEADIMSAANKIVKEHIKLLHEYNELKDVGQGLMGLIADQRGVRIVEVQEEFGIDAQD